MSEKFKVVSKLETNFGKAQLLVANKALGPGALLDGRLELDVRHLTFLRGLWIKFSGWQRVCVPDNDENENKGNHSRSNYSSRRPRAPKPRRGGCSALGGKELARVDLLKSHEEYHKGGLHEVILGLGEEDEGSYDLLQVERGTYAWSFCFSIPSYLPLSFLSRDGETLYSLTAVLDCPELSRKATTLVYYPALTHLPPQKNSDNGAAALAADLGQLLVCESPTTSTAGLSSVGVTSAPPGLVNRVLRGGLSGALLAKQPQLRLVRLGKNGAADGDQLARSPLISGVHSS